MSSRQRCNNQFGVAQSDGSVWGPFQSHYVLPIASLL